jgi:cell division protein FtsL
LLAEHSRLLLERSTFAGLQTVEVVATQELQMAFPAEIKEVVP